MQILCLYVLIEHNEEVEKFRVVKHDKLFFKENYDRIIRQPCFYSKTQYSPQIFKLRFYQSVTTKTNLILNVELINWYLNTTDIVWKKETLMKIIFFSIVIWNNDK